MKGIFKRAVLKPQQNSTFLRLLGFDFGNSRHSSLQLFQNGSEYLAMFIMEIFYNERKVFPFVGKVFGITHFLFMTRLVDMKVRYMPPLEKLSQSDDGRKSLKL